MRRSRWGVGVRELACLVFVAVSVVGGADAPSPIRLGWQIPWATQGQLVMCLKYSNIPDSLGIALDFKGFSYGSPLNQAALAGEVDVLLTADQPAIVLLSKNRGFRIVSRLMYNRVSIYVPPRSRVRTLSDLAGARVMGPVGAAAERMAFSALRREGVTLAGVKFGNLDMERQIPLLNRAGPNAAEWPGVDALYGFDPLAAVFEERGLARILQTNRVVAVVIASEKIVEARRADLQAFLTGLALSWLYFAEHPEEVNRVYSHEARFNASNTALETAASVEPNRQVRSLAALRMDFSEQDYATLEDAKRFLLEQGTIREDFQIKPLVNLGPLKAALSSLRSNNLYSNIRFRGLPP